MKPMLDATAGNRMIWGKNKQQQINKVIFIDKEFRLAIPPDIFADHRHLPFRDDVFNCVIYDPPFQYDSCPPPWWNDPTNKGRWYGFYSSRRETITMVAHAVREFLRVSKRLCLKWNDNDIPLWKILSLFRGWNEINRNEFYSKAGGTHKTYWVTFIKSMIV